MLAYVYNIAILFSLFWLILGDIQAKNELGLENYLHKYGLQGLKSPKLTVVLKEIGELTILILLFLNIRPRRWPQFFTLEMNENNSELIEGLNFG